MFMQEMLLSSRSWYSIQCECGSSELSWQRGNRVSDSIHRRREYAAAFVLEGITSPLPVLVIFVCP